MAAVFHLAFPVRDLAATRRFYGELLGCPEGRAAERWVDFDFFGHQISAHLAPPSVHAHTPVDGDAVPVPHFGAVLPWDDWHALRAHLEAEGVSFRIPPRIRFRGQPGEQATMFLDDPSGNVIELKSFREPERLFARA